MSQSKVDQRRYEKKHRKEILRKQKIKKIFAVTATVVVIAAIVGSVVGVKIYKAIPKYVAASGLSSTVDKAWVDNGYDSLFTATSSDASEDSTKDDTSEDSTDTTTEDSSDTVSEDAESTSENVQE